MIPTLRLLTHDMPGHAQRALLSSIEQSMTEVQAFKVSDRALWLDEDIIAFVGLNWSIVRKAIALLIASGPPSRRRRHLLTFIPDCTERRQVRNSSYPPNRLVGNIALIWNCAFDDPQYLR
jgi:hypothetical protein